MSTGSMMGFLDLIVIGAAVYLLYGYYLLVVRNEIKEGLLIPKDMDPKKCKDIEGYKKYMGPKILVLAAAALVSGIIGIMQDYFAKASGMIFWVFMVVFFVVIIWFGYAVKQAEKRFF